MKDIITVAVANFRVDAANKESNLSRMCGFAEAAAKRGANLILFPEMCLYGYDYYVDETIPQKRSTVLHARRSQRSQRNTGSMLFSEWQKKWKKHLTQRFTTQLLQ